MALGAFATMTLLTKNSFLDEIRKQYVMTARAKGCTERQVLYGHVFRNAMLIVIAGFPGAFVHAFFTGSLLIETIFSLDGLGLLGFESVLNRDYPVVFADALHLLAGRAGREPDLRSHLHLDRSAHRFRDAGGLRWTHAHGVKAPETTAVSADGARRAAERRRIALSPINERRWQNFKANRRGYWSLWIFLVLFVALAVRRVHRQRQAVPRQLRRRVLLPGGRRPIRRRRSAAISRPRPIIATRYLQKLIAEKGGYDALAADPLLLRHAQSRPADAGAVEADLDAHREANARRWSSARASTAAATSNTTGSAPTIRAATWWRG